jgi:multicomponent Na+:H+ antiporter subunit B
MNSLILTTTIKYLLPLLVLFSVFLLFQGHHSPGGGFIGGLMAAAPIGLSALAFDVPTARRLLPLPPHYFLGLGLLTATGSGLLAITQGKPFLTALWLEWQPPSGIRVSLGTPLLLELGIYLLVLGVVTAIMLSLAAEQ